VGYRKCVQNFGGEILGNRSLERLIKLEDNFKMDVKEMGYGNRSWMDMVLDLVQWRSFVTAELNLRFGHHRYDRQKCVVLTCRSVDFIVPVASRPPQSFLAKETGSCDLFLG
jgi:hypothetical protein